MDRGTRWVARMAGARPMLCHAGRGLVGNVQKKCPTRRPSRRLRQIVHGVVTTINTATAYRTYFHYGYVIKTYYFPSANAD